MLRGNNVESSGVQYRRDLSKHAYTSKYVCMLLVLPLHAFILVSISRYTRMQGIYLLDVPRGKHGLTVLKVKNQSNQLNPSMFRFSPRGLARCSRLFPSLGFCCLRRRSMYITLLINKITFKMDLEQPDSHQQSKKSGHFERHNKHTNLDNSMCVCT